MPTTTPTSEDEQASSTALSDGSEDFEPTNIDTLLAECEQEMKSFFLVTEHDWDEVGDGDVDGHGGGDGDVEKVSNEDKVSTSTISKEPNPTTSICSKGQSMTTSTPSKGQEPATSPLHSQTQPQSQSQSHSQSQRSANESGGGSGSGPGDENETGTENGSDMKPPVPASSEKGGWCIVM